MTHERSKSPEGNVWAGRSPSTSPYGEHLKVGRFTGQPVCDSLVSGPNCGISRIYTYMYMYVYIYICVCMNVCLCNYVCMYVYIYRCVDLFMCMYVYIHVYIYLYTHIYMYVRIYTYICLYAHVYCICYVATALQSRVLQLQNHTHNKTERAYSSSLLSCEGWPKLLFRTLVRSKDCAKFEALHKV